MVTMDNYGKIHHAKIHYFDWAMASSSQTVSLPGRVRAVPRYQSKWANQDLVEEVSNCRKNAQDEDSKKECFLDTPSVYIDLGKS